MDTSLLCKSLFNISAQSQSIISHLYISTCYTINIDFCDKFDQ